MCFTFYRRIVVMLSYFGLHLGCLAGGWRVVERNWGGVDVDVLLEKAGTSGRNDT